MSGKNGDFAGEESLKENHQGHTLLIAGSAKTKNEIKEAMRLLDEWYLGKNNTEKLLKARNILIRIEQELTTRGESW